MSNPTRLPPMTRGTLTFRNNETRELHEQALAKVLDDPNKPADVKTRAKRALMAAKLQDARYDGVESVFGETAAKVVSWPERFVAGWLIEHPDISNEDIAQRANAYLAE